MIIDGIKVYGPVEHPKYKEAGVVYAAEYKGHTIYARNRQDAIDEMRIKFEELG